jgi:hypothetical protein
MRSGGLDVRLTSAVPVLASVFCGLVLVAPGEGAIMAAPEGARAPVVEGSERVRAGRISLAIESQSVPDKGEMTDPKNRPRPQGGRKREARGGGGLVCDKLLSLR